MKDKFALVVVGLLLAAGGCSHPAPAPTNRAAPPAPANEMQGTPMSRAPATVADWAKGAMLFDGLGHAHRAISTSIPEAQRYFDQGLRLMWAFNHDEATRSFARAAMLDPNCASCYWGVALTVGPNYNLPFLIQERAKVATEALRLARLHQSKASPVEQALIAALGERYPTQDPLDTAALQPVLLAYSKAMQAVAKKYPADLDVQTLYAEALMNVHAWKLWTAEGQPAAGTDQIVATLESVLARDPNHVGANHYYVHTMEASLHPEKAVASAERLRQLAPAAGHLVHMPAHIMQRIGRYEDAAEANRRGAAADEAYFARTQAPDYYPVMYTAHNYQFLASSAAMAGRRSETVAATDSSRSAVSDNMLSTMPGADWYVAEMYTARVRFGLWDQILSLRAPDPKLPALTGGYLYARAVALGARGRIDEARATLGQLRSLIAAAPADAPAGLNTLQDVLGIGALVAQARIASAENRPDASVALLQQAVTAEDRLSYDEPKDWFFPVRHLLGAQLLQIHRPEAAEAVYRQDLKLNPENGWALYGLSSALRAQGKLKESAQCEQHFAAAWKHSDITLSASAY